MKTLNYGDITVDLLREWSGSILNPLQMYPLGSWDVIEDQRDWLEPHFLNPKDHADGGLLPLSLHSYIIRTEKHTILVDTCMGADKERKVVQEWVGMDSDYLIKLAAMGVAPEEVDFVMCTHLHFDHVGWNTRLENGRWVPTFPNARYIFNKTEYDAWAENSKHPGMDGAFADSVLPVVEAGRADLVAGDHQIDDSIWLEPSPGHSPGHVCINLQGGGKKALFTGDAFHHPIQVAYPEWSTAFCVDADMSAQARRNILARLADEDCDMLAAHFMEPTVARVISNGDRWKLKV